MFSYYNFVCVRLSLQIKRLLTYLLTYLLTINWMVEICEHGKSCDWTAWSFSDSINLPTCPHPVLLPSPCIPAEVPFHLHLSPIMCNFVCVHSAWQVGAKLCIT